MNKNPVVLKYYLIYKNLNRIFQKIDERFYKNNLLSKIIEEYKKGYIVVKINKANKCGTKVSYQRIIDFQEAKLKFKEIREKLIN